MDNPAKSPLRSSELAVASRDSNLRGKIEGNGGSKIGKTYNGAWAPFLLPRPAKGAKLLRLAHAVVFKCRWLIYRWMLHGFVGRKARNFRTPTVHRPRPLTPYCPTMGSSVPSLQVL